MASSSNSPCAACKFLRRKCTLECVFAPYFPPDQPQKFANVHKIFGASNVTKLLNELQPHQREDAVNSLAYEAEARVKDPVYGCVGAISILQHQVKQLQAELHSARSELSKYISAGMGMPQTLSSALAGAPSSCSPPLGMGMALPLSSVLSPRDHNIFRDHHHHQIMQAETQQHLSRDHHLLRGGSVNFVEQPDIVRISGGGSPYHDPHVTAAANVAYLPLTVTSGGNVSHAMVSHFSSAARAASPQEEHQHHQAALMSSPYSLQQVKGEE